MRYVCSFPACDIATFELYCRDHRAFDDARMTCLFCKGEFDSMPWYGCCAGCFQKSAVVRVLVEAATPQTVRDAEPGDWQ